VPQALAAVVRNLPGLKLAKTPNGWRGSVKISEKRWKEREKFETAWDRVKAALNKKPWSSAGGGRQGWDAQTDTGGNYAAQDNTFVHPSGLSVTLNYSNSFTTGTKVWSVVARDNSVAESSVRSEVLKRLHESLLNEADDEEDVKPEVEKEKGEDSLDAQVDKYLTDYESEAKSAKTEGLDFRRMTRRIVSEADDTEEDMTAEPGKLTAEDLDVKSYVSDVMRLVDNYDSLLEVHNTVLRRAVNFLAKNYEKDVVDAFKEELLESYGQEIGKSSQEMSDETPAPKAGEAGPLAAGASA